VESNDEVEKAENDSVSRWAVGALIFLRFLIPAVTDVASGTSGAYEREKKGAVLMGRFLMKLCCKSKFGEHSSCLLNDVLDDAADMFDRFCHDVAMIGQEYSHITFPDLITFESAEDIQKEKAELCEFLEVCGLNIQENCHEIIRNEINIDEIANANNGLNFVSEQFNYLMSELTTSISPL
jgi:hypothetical protein